MHFNCFRPAQITVASAAILRMNCDQYSTLVVALRVLRHKLQFYDVAPSSTLQLVQYICR